MVWMELRSLRRRCENSGSGNVFDDTVLASNLKTPVLNLFNIVGLLVRVRVHLGLP